MRGSIRKRGPAWQLRVHVGSGQYVSRSVRGSRRDADAAMARLLVEVGGGLHVPSSGAVFAEAAALWLERGSLAPSTRAAYGSYLSGHVLPALGDRPVTKITTAELEGLYGRLAAGGLSAGSVRKCHVIVSGVLGAALRWGWVGRNVAVGAEAPAVRQRPVEAPSAAVVASLVEAADPDFAALIRLAAITGARRGELIGLWWSDVGDGQVTFRRTVTLDGGRPVVRSGTKAGGARSVAFAGLDEHRARCAERALACGAGLGEWVFSPEPDGSRPWRPDGVTQRWARLCRRVGVSGVRFHDLRHFAATEMLAAGFDPVTVAARLGHKRSSMTLDVYASAVPARDVAAFEHMRRLLA